MPRTRSQGIVVALLFVTLALIAYGSLYPFDIMPRADLRAFGAAISELSWARAGRSDRIANILLYAPLGFCLVLLLEGRMRRGTAVGLTVAVGVALSFSIEVAQVFIAQRVPSWWDVVFNTVGAFVGATAGIAWHELAGRMRTASADNNRAARSGVFVLLLFLAWRLAPYQPQLDLGKLKAAFAPLGSPYFSIPATIHYLVWWTLVAQIVFSLVNPQRAIETLLVLIATVLASCLVIAGRTFMPSELLALVLLLPTLFVSNRLTPLPRRWILLVAFIGLFVYESFAPFRLSDNATGFNFWPFKSWIDSGFPVDWLWFARQACYFAMLVWILKAAGTTARTTVVLVPLFVLCLEGAQMWILGQRATITEPLVALAVAAAMRIVDHRR